MREVHLSRAETWPQQHLHAIRSAYGNAPWFIHYIDDIEAVLLAPHDRLIDLNMATSGWDCNGWDSPPAITVEDAHVEHDPATYRTSAPPCTPSPCHRIWKRAHRMPRVFEQRHGFVPGCSVVDLVMNLGPEARGWLLRAIGMPRKAPSTEKSFLRRPFRQLSPTLTS
ncbi:MAG: WbqC family protein [Flavobacteriales bacterium]|nr:WbqC family protein [Flavobacteriales bacterium]